MFVKDHAGEGQKAAKERLAQADSCGVTKVIGLSKLKANYKPFEAKRRLCASFDLFLADDRILPLLPPLLGKQFFKKKKQPIPVSLAGPRSDWAAEMRRATGSTSFVLGGGACSAVRCARSTQAAQQVVANILASAAGVAHYVPRGWSNIRAMYLKTNASVALPIFTCLPSLEMEGEQPGAERKKSRKSKKAKTEGGADTAAEPKDAPVAGAKRKADEAAPAKQKTTPGTTLGAQAARAATQEPAGKRAKR